jgi:DNA-binding Lrp family transcriptional regulator
LKQKASLMLVLIASVMAEAYILINCELGSEDNVIKELKVIPGVAEVKGVFGVYDIISRVSSSNDEELKKAVAKIRSHPGIKSSLTMMVIEGQGN